MESKAVFYFALKAVIEFSEANKRIVTTISDTGHWGWHAS